MAEHKCNCKDGNDKDCDCNNEEDFLSVEELTVDAHYKIDALIELLIKKKLISENEYVDVLDKFYDELDEESEESKKEDKE